MRAVKIAYFPEGVTHAAKQYYASVYECLQSLCSETTVNLATAMTASFVTDSVFLLFHQFDCPLDTPYSYGFLQFSYRPISQFKHCT
jgi:hypothetical protein